MVDRRYSDSVLFQESSEAFLTEFFDYTKNKFLHAVDTFYYSVTFAEDFSSNTFFQNVVDLRKWFRTFCPADYTSRSVYLDGFGSHLELKKSNYAGRYIYRLSLPDCFDIFFADTINSSAEASAMPQAVVQLRSYYLWSLGCIEAVERSMGFIRAISDYFKLTFQEIKENRCDYCFHTNYFARPEKFLDREKFYKMKVSHFNATFSHDHGVGESGYEIDYISLGSRSGSHFIRIYLKSKEVVEMHYKGFFLKIWLLEKMISRYDFIVLEDCLLHMSWKYMTIARLKFYLDHGADAAYKAMCAEYIDAFNSKNVISPAADDLAKKLTPEVHKVMNFEFQVMRSGSKSYELLDVDHDKNDILYPIYKYLGNHDLIVDFLTSRILRFVDYTADSKKSRCPDTDFWNRLRSAAWYDAKPNEGLVRSYNRQINEELRKKLFMRKAVAAAAVLGSDKDKSSMQLALETLIRMNDNDLKAADRYKENYVFPYNEGFDFNDFGDLVIVDKESGEMYEFES